MDDRIFQKKENVFVCIVVFIFLLSLFSLCFLFTPNIYKRMRCSYCIYIYIKMFFIVETTKGKKCLLFDEYLYHRDRIRDTNTYWRCAQMGDCHGRAVQRNDGLPIMTSPHNHDPDKKRNEIEQFQTDLKKEIRETQTPIKQIYRSELLKRYSSSPDDVCELPQYHQIKTSLYKIKNENYPGLPKSSDEFVAEGMSY